MAAVPPAPRSPAPRSVALRTLTTCPPGADVLAGLAAYDPAALTASERVDYLVAWDRCESWVAAGTARALAAFGRPAGAPDPADVAAGHVPAADSPAGRALAAQAEDERSAHAEVGFALRLGPSAVARRIRAARALAGAGATLGGTYAALQAGRVTYWHALAVADAVTPLEGDPAAIATVERRVLPVAVEESVGRTRAAAERAVIAVDPRGADERHRAARTRRSVWTRPLPDGMALLGLYDTAGNVDAVSTALDELARRPTLLGEEAGMDGSGPVGSADQRRAAALVALCRVAAEGGSVPATSASGDGSTGGRRRRTVVGVTVDLATLARLADHPGELAGYGPIPPVLARELAAGGGWRRLVTDPVTGHLLDRGTSVYTPPPALAAFVAARDGTCYAPGCDRRATQADLDHVVPFDPRDPAAGGSTSAANLRAACRFHHVVKTHHGFRVEPTDRGSRWTTPLGRIYTTRPVDFGTDRDPPEP